LEGSKAFSKDFLARHEIPTAAYRCFTESADAKKFIERHGRPMVVKADGLAAGKGVIVPQTKEEALRAVDTIKRELGDAASRIVVEEILQGEEASFIVMVDGRTALALATSQDHKRVFDDDVGPNTGGMGAYSPAPIVTAALADRIMREVIEPTVRGMADQGTPYTGFLYAGLMIAADGTPNVLEFNCRFGDPETQPVLMRLQTDLVELVEIALDGTLDRAAARWDARAALGVVMTAGGYPGNYRKGDVITGLPPTDAADAKVFHAGTAERDGQVVTNGGRVLCVTALGATVSAAQARAYEVVERIHWQDAHYRRDIGHRATAREKS
jgi:phosphoribosylamine--glycine ligase